LSSASLKSLPSSVVKLMPQEDVKHSARVQDFVESKIEVKKSKMRKYLKPKEFKPLELLKSPKSTKSQT
jgi:hypothetical protein